MRVVFLLFVLLSACVSQETIKVGGVFHLTGPAAFWGEGEKDAVLLAFEEVNVQGGIEGKTLELVIQDGKTDFAATVNALRFLTGVEEVDVIIGPTWFSSVAAPIANETRKVIISPSGGTVPTTSAYFFDLWPTERQEIIPIVHELQEKGLTKVVLVYTLNDWSQSMADVFEKEATSSGISVVARFGTSPEEKDFRTVIEGIRASTADVIYAPFAFYPPQGEFSRQFKVAGVNMPIYSSSGTENPQLLTAFPQIEGTVYAYPEHSMKEEEFAERFKARFGINLTPSATFAYDAASLVIAAFKNKGESADEVQIFLSSTKYFQGISNTISFDETGRVSEKKHIIKQVENGAFVAKSVPANPHLIS